MMMMEEEEDHATLAFAVAEVASLVVAGIFLGFRMRRSRFPVYTYQIMVSQLDRGRSLYVLPDAAIEFSGVHRPWSASLIVAGLFLCFRMRRSSGDHDDDEGDDDNEGDDAGDDAMLVTTMVVMMM